MLGSWWVLIKSLQTDLIYGANVREGEHRARAVSVVGKFPAEFSLGETSSFSQA